MIVGGFTVVTVDSRYYDTGGIREIDQYIQTIDITSTNLHCLGMVRIHSFYRDKQHFSNRHRNNERLL